MSKGVPQALGTWFSTPYRAGTLLGYGSPFPWTFWGMPGSPPMVPFHPHARDVASTPSSFGTWLPVPTEGVWE